MDSLRGICRKIGTKSQFEPKVTFSFSFISNYIIYIISSSFYIIYIHNPI